MKDIQNIPIDLKTRYVDLYLHANQHDTVRQFILEVSKNGKPYDLTGGEVTFQTKDITLYGDSSPLIPPITEYSSFKEKYSVASGGIQGISYYNVNNYVYQTFGVARFIPGGPRLVNKDSISIANSTCNIDVLADLPNVNRYTTSDNIINAYHINYVDVDVAHSKTAILMHDTYYTSPGTYPKFGLIQMIGEKEIYMIGEHFVSDAPFTCYYTLYMWYDSHQRYEIDTTNYLHCPMSVAVVDTRSIITDYSPNEYYYYRANNFFMNTTQTSSIAFTDLKIYNAAQKPYGTDSDILGFYRGQFNINDVDNYENINTMMINGDMVVPEKIDNSFDCKIIGNQIIINAPSNLLKNNEKVEYILTTKNASGDHDSVIGCLNVLPTEILDDELSVDTEELLANVKFAESYTHGGTNTRQDENTDNAKYYYEQIRSSVNGISDRGEIGYTQLDAVEPLTNFMYTITNEFVSDTRFVDGGGVRYPARTKIIYNSDGLFDCIQGELVVGVKGNSEESFRDGYVNINKASVGLPHGVNIAISDEIPSSCDYWLCPIGAEPSADIILCYWQFLNSNVDEVHEWPISANDQVSNTNLGLKIEGCNGTSTLELITVPSMKNPIGHNYKIEMYVRAVQWDKLGSALCTFINYPEVFSINAASNGHWQIFSKYANETADLGDFYPPSLMLNTWKFMMEWNTRGHMIISMYVGDTLLWSTPEYQDDDTTPFLPTSATDWHVPNTPKFIKSFGSNDPSASIYIATFKVNEVFE